MPVFLPDEVLLSAIAFLDASDVDDAALISRQAARVVGNNEHLLPGVALDVEVGPDEEGDRPVELRAGSVHRRLQLIANHPLIQQLIEARSIGYVRSLTINGGGLENAVTALFREGKPHQIHLLGYVPSPERLLGLRTYPHQRQVVRVDRPHPLYTVNRLAICFNYYVADVQTNETPIGRKVYVELNLAHSAIIAEHSNMLGLLELLTGPSETNLRDNSLIAVCLRLRSPAQPIVRFIQGIKIMLTDDRDKTGEMTPFLLHANMSWATYNSVMLSMTDDLREITTNIPLPENEKRKVLLALEACGLQMDLDNFNRQRYGLGVKRYRLAIYSAHTNGIGIFNILTEAL